jgi:hypothetical protein
MFEFSCVLEAEDVVDYVVNVGDSALRVCKMWNVHVLSTNHPSVITDAGLRYRTERWLW